MRSPPPQSKVASTPSARTCHIVLPGRHVPAIPRSSATQRWIHVTEIIAGTMRLRTPRLPATRNLVMIPEGPGQGPTAMGIPPRHP